MPDDLFQLLVNIALVVCAVSLLFIGYAIAFTL